MLLCCSSLYINYVVASAFLFYFWVLAAELLCSGMREGCLVTSWAFEASGVSQIVGPPVRLLFYSQSKAP
jgi:hypothetical protein